MSKRVVHPPVRFENEQAQQITLESYRKFRSTPKRNSEVKRQRGVKTKRLPSKAPPRAKKQKLKTAFQEFLHLCKLGIADDLELFIQKHGERAVSALAGRRDASGFSGLHYAAMLGRNGTVRVLLERGLCNVALKTSGLEAKTPLMLACRHRRNGTIRLLLEHSGSELHADEREILDEVDVDSDSEHIEDLVLTVSNKRHAELECIHIAVAKGHIEMLEALLRIRKANVDAREYGRTGRTPLIHAVDRQDMPMVRVLVEKWDADITCLHEGVSAREYATGYSRLQICAYLFEQEQKQRVVDEEKEREVEEEIRERKLDYLHTICKYKSLPTLKEELGWMKLSREDMQVADNRLGRNALHHAAKFGRNHVCRALVDDYHLDVFLEDNKGETPLTVACRCRRSSAVAVARFLAKRGGADLLRRRNRHKLSARDVAEALGNVEVFKLLMVLEYNCGLLSRAHALVARSNLARIPFEYLLRKILQRGSYCSTVYDVQSVLNGQLPAHPRPITTPPAEYDPSSTTRDAREWTKMSTAAGRGEPAAVTRCMRKRTPRIDARDDNGRTPLHLACMNKWDAECVQLLISRGAGVDDRDFLGLTPLMHAAMWPRADVLKALLDAKASPALKSDHISAEDYAMRHGRIENMLMIRAARFREGLLSEKETLEFDSMVRTWLANWVKKVHTVQDDDQAHILQDYLQSVSKLPVNRVIAECTGDTPLLLATRWMFRSNVKRLIELKADLEERDNSGCTALMVAAKQRNSKILEILVKAGADITASFMDGSIRVDALSLACSLPAQLYLERLLRRKYARDALLRNVPQLHVHFKDILQMSSIEPTDIDIKDFVESNSDILYASDCYTSEEEISLSEDDDTYMMRRIRGAGSTTTRD